MYYVHTYLHIIPERGVGPQKPFCYIYLLFIVGCQTSFLVFSKQISKYRSSLFTRVFFCKRGFIFKIWKSPFSGRLSVFLGVWFFWLQMTHSNIGNRHIGNFWQKIAILALFRAKNSQNRQITIFAPKIVKF